MITDKIVEALAFRSSYESRMSFIYQLLSKHLIDYDEFKRLDDFFCVPLIDFGSDNGRNYDTQYAIYHLPFKKEGLY